MPFMSRRRAVQTQVRAKSDMRTFPAPVRGWITNENLAKPRPAGARILDNFFPTVEGVRARGGLTKWATVHASNACDALLPYNSGTASKLFAATAAAIYEVSNPVSTTVVPSAALSGQTSGDYSYTGMATAGGEFLVAVNGADRAIYYDGTTWRRLDTANLELPYDGQTANFVVGDTVTGATSGATGVVVEDADSGTSGTLRLSGATGTFQDNENLQVGGVTRALANIPSGATAVPAITGAVTSTFSFVWSFGSRLFFVRKDTLDAYYLPVDSIGGAVSTHSLRGILNKGGKIIFGGTWSQDAGDGMDDYCYFVSSMGQVAVYQGFNPASWSLVNVYELSEPLHKNATMRAGGDVLIATKEGLVPLSAAMAKDPGALALAAVSRPIEPTWRRRATRYEGRWVVAKWVEESLGLIGYPADETGVYSCFVVNLQTGAWARYTNWNVNCAVAFDGDLYIGTSTGKVYKAEEGGRDDTAAYYCTYVGLHENFGNPIEEKTARMARTTWRYGNAFNYRSGVAANYEETLVDYPPVAPANSSDVWDTGLWDVALWSADADYRETQTEWQGVAGRGFVLSPVVQCTFGSNVAPRVELVSFDLVYERGGIVT